MPVVISLGDFNDNLSSETIHLIEKSGVRSLMTLVSADDRYTFVYNGVSQVNDHVFYYGNHNFVVFPVAVPIHINVDYPTNFAFDETIPFRSSDHDPVYVGFFRLGEMTFLPIVAINPNGH